MNPTKQRLSDAQIIRIAAFERHHGKAFIMAPGPRRSRILSTAGENAVVVMSDEWFMQPIISVIEENGDMWLSEVVW